MWTNDDDVTPLTVMLEVGRSASRGLRCPYHDRRASSSLSLALTVAKVKLSRPQVTRQLAKKVFDAIDSRTIEQSTVVVLDSSTRQSERPPPVALEINQRFIAAVA
jgi:hypothetical protein